MEYLDPPLKLDNPKVESLHDLLAQAYPDLEDAQIIAKRTGLPAQSIPQSASNMGQFWWDTMIAMADAGILPKLVEVASKDEQRKGYWSKFRQHLVAAPSTVEINPPNTDSAETGLARKQNNSDSDKGGNSASSLSQRTAISIASIGFLVIVLLLWFMVYVGPRLVQQGMDTAYFYVLLVILGTAVAALVFGGMRSSATLTYKSPLGVLDLAGPIVGIVVIVAGYFVLVPHTDTFDFTVRIRTITGVFNSGTVRLIAGPSTLSAPVNDNGEADFKNLPQTVRAQAIRLEVWDGLNNRLAEQTVTVDATTDVVEIPITPPETVTSTCATLLISGFTVNDGKEERQILGGGTYTYARNTHLNSLVIRPVSLQEPVECIRLTYKWEYLTANGAISPEKSSDDKLVFTLSPDGKETKIRVIMVDETSKNQASAILNIVPQD